MIYTTVDEIRTQFSSENISEAEIIAQINLFLEHNNIQQAYPYLCFLSSLESCSEATLMTSGLVALSLQEKGDARTFFEKLLNQNNGHFDARYNLALLEMEDGNPEAARDGLKILIEQYPENAELYNDLAVIYTQLDNIEEAYSSWEESLKLNPNESLHRNNVLEFTLQNDLIEEGLHILKINKAASQLSNKTEMEIKRWSEILEERASKKNIIPSIVLKQDSTALQGHKIAIFASINTFIKDIAEFFAENNEIRFYESNSKQEMAALLEWADISWFEWCDQLLIEATKLKKTSKIICRLHSYEAFSDMPLLVDWQKVDLLMFVNESVQEIVNKSFSPAVEQIVIHNGLDVDRYQLQKNKSYGKKIASVGYINYKKNPALLLYCFDKIHTYDSEYSLHIAGKHQDPRIQLYFDHYLKEKDLPVYFDGWIDNMTEWYADKDFVISTSLFESFHYSIAEGMASGLMPLIHSWYGAENLYPNEFLFKNPDDCLRLLKEYETTDKSEIAIANRTFIADKYSQKKITAKISSAVHQLISKEKVAI